MSAAETNIKININDVWKDVDSVKINISDVWKDVTEVKINIGDTWKTVSGTLNGYLKTESWDGPDPPENWPECDGVIWNDWTPKNYDCNGEGGGDSSLDTTIKHSGTRSLKVTRLAGDKGVCDLIYNISPAITKIHLRMYVYFGANCSGMNGSGEEELIHFVFFNSAVSGVNFGIDIHKYSDYQPESWPPLCNPTDTSGYVFFNFHSYHDDWESPGGGCPENEESRGPTDVGDCWNIRDHLEEWHCYEWMWDLDGHEVKLWVDGNLKTSRTMVECYYSSINKIILSGWNSCGACIGEAHTFYLDDIIIAESYIGT